MRTALVLATLSMSAVQGNAQTSATTTDWYARNMTRLESWLFFEPASGGGDPTSTYLGNRLQFGFRRRGPRVDLQAAGQFVQLGWLPARAAGPGPLGLGAVYFDHAGTRHPGEAYLKYLNVRFKEVAPGVSVQVGRFSYTSGAEAVSGEPKVEAVKRLRIDSRLIGEFEFSFYQRSFDGVRVDYSRRQLRATAAAFLPTQGGFEEDANRTLTDVVVLAGAVTFQPGAPLPPGEWQFFSYRYDDSREVTGRPDNQGTAAAAADVHVTTFGTTYIVARPAGPGELDAVLWLAVQTGRWYETDHRASAVSLEAGYQWNAARARPWVRGGWLRGSGDRDPSDRRHETFFQMLPTVRRHALSASYSQMNLRDLFLEVLLTPTPRLSTRAEVHRLTLDRGTDRWYFGSGATQRAGRVFGFATRPSGGATKFGTVTEGSVDVRVLPRLMVGGYLGWIRGSDVVSRTFAGGHLLFAFIESTLQF